ncbi:unnamed protein product [Cochlearia groenlandica]
MADTFPREDPFSILMPPAFDMDMVRVHSFVFFSLHLHSNNATFSVMYVLLHQGPIRPPVETDITPFRVDFVREVDALLQEIRIEQEEEEEEAGKKGEGLDPEAIALKLKQHEKKRTIRQVEAILDLALNLKW